ncbi:MAG: hypothetical protein LBR89_00110, partial [Holosporales bacterium]|nr:hypothetical protein [Holosporales bacterium]
MYSGGEGYLSAISVLKTFRRNRSITSPSNVVTRLVGTGALAHHPRHLATLPRAFTRSVRWHYLTFACALTCAFSLKSFATTTLSADTSNASFASVIGSNTTLSLNNYTLTLTAANTLANTVTILGPGTLAFTSNTTSTIDATLSDGVITVKQTTGTLNLNVAIAKTNIIALSNGTLNANAPIPGKITMAAGTLNATDSLGTSEIALTGGTLVLKNTTDITYPNIISGAGTLTKSNTAGIVTFSSASHTRTGPTNVQGSRVITLAPLGTGAVAISGAGIYELAPTENVSFNNITNNSGTGFFIKTGPFSATSAGTYTGGGSVRVEGGDLTIPAATADGNTLFVAEGSTYYANGDQKFKIFDGAGTIEAGTYKITASNGTSTFAGVINAGTFEKMGGGTTTLTNTNNISGLTTITAGTLSLVGSLGSGAITIPAAGILSLAPEGAFSYLNPITFSGAGSLIMSSDGEASVASLVVSSGVTTLINVQKGTLITPSFAGSASTLTTALGGEYIMLGDQQFKDLVGTGCINICDGVLTTNASTAKVFSGEMTGVGSYIHRAATYQYLNTLDSSSIGEFSVCGVPGGTPTIANLGIGINGYGVLSVESAHITSAILHLSDTDNALSEGHFYVRTNMDIEADSSVIIGNLRGRGGLSVDGDFTNNGTLTVNFISDRAQLSLGQLLGTNSAAQIYLGTLVDMMLSDGSDGVYPGKISSSPYSCISKYGPKSQAFADLGAHEGALNIHEGKCTLLSPIGAGNIDVKYEGVLEFDLPHNVDMVNTLTCYGKVIKKQTNEVILTNTSGCCRGVTVSEGTLALGGFSAPPEQTPPFIPGLLEVYPSATYVMMGPQFFAGISGTSGGNINLQCDTLTLLLQDESALFDGSLTGVGSLEIVPSADPDVWQYFGFFLDSNIQSIVGGNFAIGYQGNDAHLSVDAMHITGGNAAFAQEAFCELLVREDLTIDSSVGQLTIGATGGYKGNLAVEGVLTNDGSVCVYDSDSFTVGGLLGTGSLDLKDNALIIDNEDLCDYSGILNSEAASVVTKTNEGTQVLGDTTDAYGVLLINGGEIVLTRKFGETGVINVAEDTILTLANAADTEYNNAITLRGLLHKTDVGNTSVMDVISLQGRIFVEDGGLCVLTSDLVNDFELEDLQIAQNGSYTLLCDQYTRHLHGQGAIHLYGHTLTTRACPAESLFEGELTGTGTYVHSSDQRLIFNTLSSSSISALVIDSDSELWLGADGAGRLNTESTTVNGNLRIGMFEHAAGKGYLTVTQRMDIVPGGTVIL